MAVPEAVPMAVFADPPAVPSPPIASSATTQPSSMEDDSVESTPLPELEPPDLSTRQLAAMVGSVMPTILDWPVSTSSKMQCCG